jgi:hypothetical protein
MSDAEVRAFAARHGIRYPRLPNRLEVGEFGVITRELVPGEDPIPAANPWWPRSQPVPVPRSPVVPVERKPDDPPLDPHAFAPGDWTDEDGRLPAAA